MIEKERLKKLILYVVSQIEASGNKTSLLKLLNIIYLFDMEYYRENKKTFTEVDWIHGPVGPYSKQLDLLFYELLESGDLIKISNLGTNKISIDTKNEQE